jgi:hypothetical protein
MVAAEKTVLILSLSLSHVIHLYGFIVSVNFCFDLEFWFCRRRPMSLLTTDSFLWWRVGSILWGIKLFLSLSEAPKVSFYNSYRISLSWTHFCSLKIILLILVLTVILIYRMLWMISQTLKMRALVEL